MTTPGRLSILLTIFSFVHLSGTAQCLTGFDKLLPEPSTDYSAAFGQSFSVYHDLMAVGAPSSDSLGRITGLVFVYRRQADNTWKKIASLAPSDPLNSLAFGQTVKLSANYLAVGAAGYGGSVYVFKKPAGDWSSAVEDYKLSVPGTVSFGVGMRDPVDISADELTLAIVDQNLPISNFPSKYGAIYVYHRQSGDEWSDHAPSPIFAPTGDVVDFGRTGVYVVDDRIITATPFSPTGYGTAYIFRDPSGQFNNMTLEAKLTTTPTGSGTGNIGFQPMIFTEDGLLAVATIDYNSVPKGGLVFFPKPTNNIWTDAEPSCQYVLAPGPGFTQYMSMSTNGTDIYLGFRDTAGNNHFGIMKKGTNGWCNPSLEIIKTVDASSGNYASLFGVRSSSSADNATVGMTTLPTNSDAAIALETFHKTGSSWASSLLYNGNKTTGGHFFGRSVLTLDDNLFVGSPYDGTVKSSGGAVYTYKKLAGAWVKTGKIPIPTPERYDDVFGFALATNGEQLAVGAPGIEPAGGVFIYEKNGGDWSNPTLVQEIQIPEELDPGAYGDNLAMSDDWLVIPFLRYSLFRLKLAIYKKNGNQWESYQTIETSLGNFFARSTTVAVDIDGETLVAGGTIFQRNINEQWTEIATLTPSDPEPMRISPDFTHWVSNGNLFGTSVDIRGDQIFIGAPAKDFGSTWDVGAVYVYTRRPGFAWSSMTESAKILPRVKTEGELFGYTLDGLENTLIVGAPGADYWKDGVTPRNMPGRAYIFQSKDYYWQNIIALQDFTGDSFTKDYFGLAVGLDGANFLIGACIEDISTGKLSGSVYVAPSPPIVKLFPPTCLSYTQVNLFGYPFGGTWSGPGLINATTGTFSPALAGVGVHEFEYSTPSCAYTGKMVIEVVAPPSMTPITPSEVLVCKEETSISVHLAVSNDVDAFYHWYYREPDGTAFESTGERAPAMFAKKRGDYFVNVYNEGCSLTSPFITIHDEEVEIKIDLPPVLCAKPSNFPLTATPAGGTWTGSGVSGSSFNTTIPGSYPVTYTYTSTVGCNHTEQISLDIQAAFQPNIARSSGHLCDQGAAMLSIGQIPANAFVDWQFKAESSTAYYPLGIAQSSIIATENGSYIVNAIVGECPSASNPFVLDDELDIELIPNAPEISVCHNSTTQLTTTALNGSIIHWNFSTTPGGMPEVISTDATLEVSEDGYYFAQVEKGVCSATSKTTHITIQPQDTLSAPNVFTPNGDGKNDRFAVSLGTGRGEITLFNRYGRPVFEGSEGSQWDGGNHPAGVYFWIARLKGCEGDTRTAKGYVQLIR